MTSSGQAFGPQSRDPGALLSCKGGGFFFVLHTSFAHKLSHLLKLIHSLVNDLIISRGWLQIEENLKQCRVLEDPGSVSLFYIYIRYLHFAGAFIQFS